MPVSRITAQWSGWSGQPGFTNFHYADIRGDETSHLAKVQTFLMDVLGGPPSPVFLPGVININVNPIVQTFDEISGDLLATTVGAAPAVIDGPGTSTFAGPVGACISWTTGLVHDVPGGTQGPHLVRGRTFLVPLTGTAFDTDGTMTAAALTDMNTAVAAFLTNNPDFVIWSRPVGGTGGAFGVAVAGVVRDKAAVLRSRRD